jgi:hypothetical protein
MHLSIEVATMSFETTHVRSQGPSMGEGGKNGHAVSIIDLRDDSLVIIWNAFARFLRVGLHPEDQEGPPSLNDL